MKSQRKLFLFQIVFVLLFCLIMRVGNAFSMPPQADLSSLTWTQAFDAMHAKMSKEYAFTAWDAIDWSGMYSKYRPMIVEAEKKSDEAGYCRALLGYISSLRDYHAHLFPVDTQAEQLVENELQHDFGGSYGLIVSKVDGEKYVVAYVAAQGAAAEAGVKVGDEIISWNDKSIQQAVNESSLLWSGIVDYGESTEPGTDEGIVFEKLRFLVRNEIGKRINVTLKSNATGNITKLTLTANDDAWDTIHRTSLYKDSIVNNLDYNNMVQYEILPSGYGYIKVLAQDFNTEDAKDSASYKRFAMALQTFNEKNVPGVILDLRGNMGNGHELASDLIGFFYNQQQSIANLFDYNTLSGKFERSVLEDIYPQDVYYNKQLLVLTDIGTVSSGEYITFGVKKLPTTHILSFYDATRSSLSDNFAGTSENGRALVIMPGGYRIYYPDGYITDLQNKIIIQVDQSLHGGGVATDVKIPLTAQTAIDIYTNGKDPALDFAQQCFATECWNNHASSNSNDSWLETVGYIAAGSLAVVGGAVAIGGS